MVMILRAIILGILQGVTEFIPISSSAHLVFVPWLFGWTDEPVLTSLAFDVALHLGTLAALLWYFAADWARLFRAGINSVIERKIGSDPDRRVAWVIVIGSIPGVIAGILFEDQVNNLFHTPNTPMRPSAMIAMAVVIALFGAVMLLAERLAQHTRGMDQLNLKDALVIGTAQALAIFPGVSRSGATITAGLAMGLERPTAARFSFLLSAPIMAGAGAKSLLDVFGSVEGGLLPSSELILFLVGFVAAAVSGYLCIKFLLRYLQQHPINIFAYYRWAVAILLTIVAFARM
jgi:undecaprenyl-diphosphatase